MSVRIIIRHWCLPFTLILELICSFSIQAPMLGLRQLLAQLVNLQSPSRQPKPGPSTALAEKILDIELNFFYCTVEKKNISNLIKALLILLFHANTTRCNVGMGP